MTTTAPDAPVPVLHLDTVFHVGTLNPGHKGTSSLEGRGLSVSVHPYDWTIIARLGGGRTWTLTRPEGHPFTFLDAHELTDAQRDLITNWGLNRGYIEPVTAYRVTWFDEDFKETVSILTLDGDDANAEADDESRALADGTPAPVTVETVHAATPAFPDSHVRTDRLDPFPLLLTVWVDQTRPDLDGVWWEDHYTPELLSCPRGVLTLTAAASVVAS